MKVQIDGSECSERYRKIMDMIHLCLRICATEVIDPNWRWSWLNTAFMGLSFIFFSCTFYTLYVGIVVEGNWLVLLQTSCFIGAGAQALCKMLCGIGYRHTICDMQHVLTNLYLEYNRRHSGYQTVLLNHISLTSRFMKTFMALYSGTIFCCMVFPAGYYAIYQERLLIMQFLLPGIDSKSSTGYALLCVTHIVCLIFGGLGNVISDILMFQLINNMPLIKDILRLKFNDMNEHLNGNVDKAKVHDAMLDIIGFHQLYLRMLESANKAFWGITFVQVFAAASGILCTMFCILMGLWPAAPAYLVNAIMCLYFTCGMGNIVELANDDCSKIIYTECNWYELPLPEQKLLMLMLHQSQVTHNLTVGNMMPLTMNTAVQLSKAVYSFVMLLTRDD